MSGWKKISSLVQSKALYNLVPANYTFTPNRENVIKSRFRLRYSATCDSYYRDWSDAVNPSSPGVLTGWERGLKNLDSVCRIVDEQTGKVYLDRYKNISTASLKWTVDFGCSGLLVDQVTLRVVYQVEGGGEFNVTIEGDNGRKRACYRGAGDYATFSELEDSAELVLSIHLIGEADQITRLFPQSIMGGMDYPLDIKVTLKLPLETLARPRMLLGVMYSNSQDIQVDGRHYKEDSSSRSGRGFLHIHLLKGRDLPVGGGSGTYAKCCFLPDAKRKTKCKTTTKKGKDPDWDEEFLVVGVQYHEIKRRALEVCIVGGQSTSGKNANILGGVRLSLGYKNVIAAQTAQISKILKLLTGKDYPEEIIEKEPLPEESDTDGSCQTTSTDELPSPDQRREETVMKGDSNANITGAEIPRKMKVKTYRTTTRLSDLKVIIVESEEYVEEGDISFTSLKELTVSEDAYGINGSLDILSVVKTEKETHTNILRTDFRKNGAIQSDGDPTECNIVQRGLSSVVEDTKEDARDGRLVNGITENSEKELSAVLRITNEDARVGGLVRGTGGTRDERSSDQSLPGPGTSKPETSRLRGNNNGGCKDKREKREKRENLQPLTSENGGKSQVESKNEDKTEEEHKAEVFQAVNPVVDQHSAVNDPEEKCTRKMLPFSSPHQITSTSTTPVKDNAADVDELEKTLREHRRLRKALSDAEANYNQKPDAMAGDPLSHSWAGRDRSMSEGPSTRRRGFSMRGFGKKLNVRKSSVQNPNASLEKEGGVEKRLEVNADRHMLDAQGLEIVQWDNVVNRPKKWHYCWHLLREDMTPMHLWGSETKQKTGPL